MYSGVDAYSEILTSERPQYHSLSFHTMESAHLYTRSHEQEYTAREIFINTFLGFLGLSVVLVISSFFGLSFPLFVAALLIVAIPIIRIPESGLHILILATMIFERLFALQSVTVGESEIKFFLFDVVLALTILSLLLQSPARSFIFPKAITGSILVYVMVVLFWAGMSMRRGGEPALIVSAVKNMAVYPILFFVALHIVRKRVAWERVIQTMFIGGVAISAFIIYGIFAGKGLWVDMTPLSTEGTRMLGAPHAFFLLVAMSILMSWYAMRAPVGERLSRWVIPLFSLWSLGLVVGLFRNLWLGYGLVAIVVGVLLPTHEARARLVGLFVKAGALAGGALLVGLWLSVLLARNTSAIESFGRPLLERLAVVNPRAEDTSTVFRTLIFQEGMRIFRAHPLIGIGFGQNVDVEMEEWVGEQDIRELHNTYAELAVQTGVVGLLSFGGILFTLFAAGRRSYKNVSFELKPSMIAVVSFLVMLLGITAFGTYFQTNMYLLFFWTSAALLVSPLYFNAESGFEKKEEILGIFYSGKSG